MGDRTTCGANRDLGDGLMYLLLSSRQIYSARPWERPFAHPSFLTCFPNTSTLPKGSLILPPQGQISISVSLSSCPDLMSLFKASPMTELLLNPLCVIAQKSSLFAKGGPWYFILLEATDERVSSFMG